MSNSSTSYKFTDHVQAMLNAAITLARECRSTQVHPVHLASTLFNEGGAAQPSLFVSAIRTAGGDTAAVQQAIQRRIDRLPSQGATSKPISLGTAMHQLLREAQSLQKAKHDQYIAQDHLLLALLKDPTVASVAKECNIDEAAFMSGLGQLRDHRHNDNKTTSEPSFTALNKYAQDLTAAAEEGKLDPVIGRDNEIRRAIHILSRRTKHNPVFIGPPGVGKTAIAEGLAQRIVKRDVPDSLICRLFSLDMGALMAGAKFKGDFEQRIKDVLNEVEKSQESGTKVILFIDEMHLLMAGGGGEGGGMDAANLLKPLLARGKLRCIGATTLMEYRKYIETDAALERRFAQVLVNEPSVAEALSILRGLREKYEIYHAVRIADAALVQAATFAKRYLTSRRLPDSAIDLVDEACASVRVARETWPEDIEKLERRKLELDIEIHALERETDSHSRERLPMACKELANLDEKLHPLKAAYEVGKNLGKEIADLRREIDELKFKADDAERKYDLGTASELRYHDIPELENKLKRKEARKAADNGKTITDTVTPQSIAEIVARWTGVPVTNLLSTEKEKLLRMEKVVGESVVGQPEAVRAVANAIRLSRSGLRNVGRPIASFLFAGPSGTGKTLLSKTLATLLFDSPDTMIRVDASEYSEKHSISRLIGAPPGYVGHEAGGQLTEYVRRKPYCIVLIDEIEKACREFVTIFLQVLDDGRLTDGQGRVVDFRNVVVIMTSNLGAFHINDAASTFEGAVPPTVKRNVIGSIKKHFPPEFINRIDDIIVFRPLSKGSIGAIVELRLQEVVERLKERKIELDVDQAARNHLAVKGYTPEYGARPLGRTILNELLNPLSVFILGERVRDKETVRVRFDPSRKRLKVLPNHEGTGEDIEMDDSWDDMEM